MDSVCPQCQSKAFKRNGYTRHGKQNHRCLDCGRQFSLEPSVFFENNNATERYTVLTSSKPSIESHL